MGKEPSLRRALVEEYRRLVRLGPSESALRDAMRLVQSVANVQLTLADVEDQLRSLDDEENLATRVQSSLSEDILEFARSRLDADAAKRSAKRSGLARKRLLGEAAITMMIPAVSQIQSGLSAPVFSLLLDAALVVLHQAYFGYVADPGRADSQDRGNLLYAAIVLSEQLPPADRARIRALVSEANGDRATADIFYREALRFTKPNAHEFMSVLQSAWSNLTEQRRFADALVLLDTYARQVRPADVPELEELLLETMRIRRAA